MVVLPRSPGGLNSSRTVNGGLIALAAATAGPPTGVTDGSPGQPPILRKSQLTIL